MELFIRIKNGVPVGHPILAENLRQCFPEIDTSNLPPEFARFERVPPINVSDGENVKLVFKGYAQEKGRYKDKWGIEKMNKAEMDANKPAIIYEKIQVSYV
jgi:hypothetical protein